MIGRKLLILSLIALTALLLFSSCRKVVAEEYEAVAAHTKSVSITNATQTDVGVELFTVTIWGKLVSSFTWGGEAPCDLNLLVNFWTIALKEANQADYGDLGWVTANRSDPIPIVSSLTCELYQVADEELPVTIFYEVDSTNNPDHTIECGPLSMTAQYYNLIGEEAAREKASAAGLTTKLLVLGIFVVIVIFSAFVIFLKF